MEGVIHKSTGSWYEVKTSDGQSFQCRLAGKIRLKGLELTNPVAIGDRVLFETEASHTGQGIISDILPRTNYIVRQSPRQKHQMHLIAANIDQAAVIVTLVKPTLKPGFIDRYLLMTEPHDIPALIIFNKFDLYDEKAREELAYFSALYEQIGYRTFTVSAFDGTGLEALRQALWGKMTLIGGQSGVGKSTLVSALFPGLDLKTGLLSKQTGKGMHTTTFAEMFDVTKGTHIIDTPGIKLLSYNNLSKMDVAHNFREFFLLSAECRFGGACTHTVEPGCAVLKALENEEISPYRYQNYLNIIEDIDGQNYWERKKEY